MKVVLDSNIIIADFWLESVDFKLLFESSKKGDIEVYIPKVVLDEVFNKYVKRLEESENTITKEITKFNKLSKTQFNNTLTATVIEESLDKYQSHLLSIIDQFSITVMKYPKTGHDFLVQKAINKRKPFNSNEKGYRDCLIWENIKSLLIDFESSAILPQLVFVSNNHKDFATKEYELHADLISELKDEDFDSKSVIVYPKLGEFNEKQNKLFFVQSESFEQKLKKNDIWNFDLQSEIKTYLFSNYVGSGLLDYDVQFEYEHGEPTISAMYEDFKIEITSVKKLNATEYVVDVKFEVNSEIDFHIDKGEYWSNSEDKSISIQDADWNKWMMWATTEMLVPIKMSLIIDGEFNINSFQINKENKSYDTHYS